MKVVIALCSVVFFASCVGADGDGSRSGTEDRGENLRFTPSMCPTPDSLLYVSVTEAGNNCVKLAMTQETASQMRDARTRKEFRDVFKKFCQKQSLIRSCLAETTDQMEVCQNETFSKLYKSYRDTIETTLDLGCNDDGEQLATLWFELADAVVGQDKHHVIDHGRECFDRYKLMVDELEKSNIDIPSKLHNLHQEIVVLAECLHRVDLEQSLKDRVKSLMDVIINRMKCIHPRDGTLVPCVTIDAGLITATSVCEWKTIGTEMSLYDVLEEDSGACSTFFLSYADEDVDSTDKIRSIVENECKHRTPLPYCYNMSRIISKMCLNNTQQKEFNLLGDFMKSAYEDACLEDGRRLSEIAYEFYRLKRTGQGDAVWDCIDVAISTRNLTDEHGSSSKNMRFYHETEAFKGCLVNKLQGDPTSVAAATSLIDELLKKVKCVHPGDGTTVLCETLHANKVQ